MGCTKSPLESNRSSISFDHNYEPDQIDLDGDEYVEISINKGNLEVYLAAEYSIHARVIRTKKYRWGWSGEIAPIDAVLAWGKLTDPETDDDISYSQRHRWYYFKPDSDCPLSTKYIYQHSANCHLIGDNDNIQKAIKTLANDDLIVIEGYLVKIKGTHKKRTVHWNSSLRRTDTGDGACEIIYITSLQINDKLYD